jgi:glutamine---fructose-6-phosphate transaminase (isomerizing)
MADKGPSSVPWIGGVEPSTEVRAMSMVEIYEQECREQPARLAELLKAYAEDIVIREEIRKLKQMASTAGPILFAGMGASYCSAVAGASLLQANGRSSFVVDAGEWLHYALPAWNQVAATVLLTTSGESAELVELCKRNPGKPLALICNHETSTCWSLAGIKLPIMAGPEYGNATKTYTNATAAAIVVASEMLGRDWQADASRVMAILGPTLERVFDGQGELEEFCRGAANIEVIGRGPGYGAAFMGGLCMREMTGKRGAAHTGAGFRHGPLLDVCESHLAIILAVGRAAELGVKLAKDCNERDGRVILVTTKEQAATGKLLPVKIAEVPEPWEAVTSILVPQALTLGMLEKYGAHLAPRFCYGPMTE